MNLHLKKSFLAIFFFVACIFQQSFAITCDPGFIEVNIVIDPDSWPEETTWEVLNADGVSIAEGNYLSEDICVEADACHTFILYDSYGDGIYAPNGVELYYDGILIATFSGDFGLSTSADMGCPPGTSCGSALEIVLGTYTADLPNTWYAFTPEDTGSYIITTCDLGNTCDNKIWVYDHCEGLIITEFAEGTFTFNDNYCDVLAQVSTIFLGGKTYYIRIGDNESYCDGTPISFQITYEGPPVGCSDPYACNYDPLAIADDGSCIFPGSPDCPAGPDLVLEPSDFDGEVGGWGDDFTLETLNTSSYSCYLEEGSFTGEGIRYVLTFGVTIWNLGDEDYHIGHAGESPYLVFSSCHGHYHYVDYGDYKLYDALGNEIPCGHKNGYAVMDLCGIGGYNGYDMGISAGCYDAYGKGTGGQWIDLTDVPDGEYTFVARVNQYNHPDIDGRTEINLANNWASACLSITRDTPGGIPTVETLDDCPAVYDCYGEIFGSAVYDCNGICNGPTLIGDLNEDTLRTFDDADIYIEEILNNTIIAASCNDANADSDIDVYDAALINGCSWENLGAVHTTSLCAMPIELSSYTDTVTLSIGAINTAENYVDIYSFNPSCEVLAYQFSMDGITIDSVINLASETLDHNFKISHSLNEVIGLGYDEVGYEKRYVPNPIARIYYHTEYPTEICIDYISTIVNELYHEVTFEKENACVEATALDDRFENTFLNVEITPNPFSFNTTITFNNKDKSEFNLQILDLNGHQIQQFETSNGNSFVIERSNLPAGIYIYKLTNHLYTSTGNLIIQ